MDIVLNQSYEIDNLVTQSGKFTVTDFQKALMNISNVFKDYAINNGEYVITTTRALENVGGEQILDMEILLPITYHMALEEPFLFKSKIKINNALYAMVEDVTKLQKTLNEINQYIIDNKIQPITSAYLVQTKKDNRPCIEIYIGINSNIL